MNFDNLKSNYQSLSYGGGDNNNVDFTKRIEGIVEQVRKEDQKEKQRLVGISIVAAGFALVYSLIGLSSYLGNSQGTDYWGYLLYVLGIIAFAPLMIREFHRTRRVNYDVSLIQFIENVDKRFSLFQTSDFLLIPGLVLLSFSFAFMVSKSEIPTVKTMILAVIIQIIALTIGFLIRLILWRKKLVLRDELLRIKESMM